MTNRELNKRERDTHRGSKTGRTGGEDKIGPSGRFTQLSEEQ